MKLDELKLILKLAYEQGYFNGHADAIDGLLDEACADDWLSEVIADKEIAGVPMPDLSQLD